MRFTGIGLTTAVLCTSIHAFQFPSISLDKRQSSCPSVWSTVATDLQTSFVADNGTCTDDARASVRLAFHDCFPGACDGSILLSDECTARGENTQLVSICSTLSNKTTAYNVSAADMVQFAAAIGIASCSGGPVTSFYAGRTSTSTANAANQLPSPSTNATTLVSLFSAKGFSATELVALVGAHTIGKRLSGAAMDTTPGTWDTDFYAQTTDNSAPSSLDSDRFLSNSSETSGLWGSVGASVEAFNTAFVPAMEKLSLLGNDKASLTDCSSVVSGYADGTLSQKGVDDEGSTTGSKSGAGRGNASAMMAWAVMVFGAVMVM